MAFKSRPVSLGLSDTIIYSCPAGTEAAVVITISNVTSTAAKYTLRFYSQNTGAEIGLAQDVSVPGNTPVKFPAPLAMESGDRIIMTCDPAGALRAFATVTEGTPGPQAKGLRPRGEYSAAATYDTGDVVTIDGSSYVSRSDNNTANDPATHTANWMVLVLRGPQGLEGPPGDPGTEGPVGPAPTIGSITATTLAPGASATVDWTGLGTVESPLAIIFGIPQGPAGEGGGNVNPTGTIIAGRMAVFADETGNLIGAGPALHAVATSGNAGDLDTGTLASARLPNSGATAGSYGASGAAIPNFTIDAKGRITAIADRSLTPANIGALPVANPTSTGKFTTAASAAGGAGFNLPPGAAPTAPVNGDLWTLSTGVFVQYGGATRQLATVDMVPAKAAGTDFRTGTDDAKFLTSKALRDAFLYVTINPAAVDLSSFINGKCTITANTTFNAPTGVREGQSGTIEVTSGGAFTTAFNTFWDFGADGVPTLSTTAGKVDTIHYRVRAGGASAECVFKAAV
ncbi:hypothetical protein ACFOYU_11230 [Microvirga sp. GCM10011540]|uniref:hypothetical protein n=1 Tax=Microvirga sp. GCM10011540 TaxID=3317338 RepID=UPI0036139E9C